MSASLAAAGATPRFALGRRFLAGYGLVLSFVIFTTILVILHAGGILNIAFPVMATAFAALLFSYRRGVYLAFAWWVWLFAPLVRRLVDYQTDYHALSPVIVTPLFVASLAFIPLLRRPRLLLHRQLIPFLLIFLVYVYAFIFGIIANGLLPACYDFANYSVPLAFGLLIYLDKKRSVENRQALMFAIVLGLLFVSLYGIYQFYDIPPWDQYWLSAAKFHSAGTGEAEQVRLFGTLNSPGPYGFVLMASLIFILALRGPLRIAAAGFGFPAFGLSLVRAAWGGWVFAVVFMVLFVRGRVLFRIIIGTVMIGLLATPFLTAQPVTDALTKRFATFNNIQQDGSYQARANLYQNFTISSLSNPLGIGFGGNGLGTKLSEQMTGGFDSGILQVPYQFGWVFGSMFVWAIILLIVRAIATARKTKDNVRIAASGVFLAMIAENLAAPMFPGSEGMIIWISLALALGPSV